MAETSRAPRSEDLLFERERQGIRTLTIVRGLFVLIVVATVWIVGVNMFEKMATTAIAVPALAAIWLFLFLLARRRSTRAVGFAGCCMDIAILSTLPVIWYVSAGGTSVPPTAKLEKVW